MPKKLILIVDDDEGLRRTRALLCIHAGHEVITAVDGFDGIMQLKVGSLPDLIISDLNMPHMSGFEFLSVVRRRFPLIRVLASSAAYLSGNEIPGGVIADSFCSKAGQSPQEFLQHVEELLAMPECTFEERQSLPAPVWIPTNGRDAAGIPYVIVSCTTCLRSFPVSLKPAVEDELKVRETECLHCGATINFVVDVTPGASAAQARVHRSEVLRKAMSPTAKAGQHDVQP